MPDRYTDPKSAHCLAQNEHRDAYQCVRCGERFTGREFVGVNELPHCTALNRAQRRAAVRSTRRKPNLRGFRPGKVYR